MKNRRCTVLIAEADRAIAHSLRSSFEQAGFMVFSAFDGDQAAILAARQRFELMVIDLELPEVNGAEFSRHVREELQLTEVPIVACSTVDMESEAQSLVFRYGISHVFYKPVNAGLVVDFAREIVEQLVSAI